MSLFDEKYNKLIAHSNMVQKVVFWLPILALAGFFLLIVLPSYVLSYFNKSAITLDKKGVLQADSEQSEIVGLDYFSINNSDRISLLSPRVSRVFENSELINFDEPSVFIEHESGEQSKLTSFSASLHRNIETEENFLELVGNVVYELDNNKELTNIYTDRAMLNLQNYDLQTLSQTLGVAEFGVFNTTETKVLDGQNKIYLIGESEVFFNSKALEEQDGKN